MKRKILKWTLRLTATGLLALGLLIREQLKDKGVIDENWKKAIKLIHDRVTDRYLNPLHILVDNEKSCCTAICIGRREFVKKLSLFPKYTHNVNSVKSCIQFA